MRLKVLWLSLVVVFALGGQSKRPMTYADTVNWKSISGQKLSADGKYLGYALFPQDADGEVVLRNLATNAEIKEPAGLRPPPPPPDPEREGPPVQRTSVISFSPDSKYAAFTTFPKKGAEKGKPGLVVANLSNGVLTRVENVKSYQMPSEATSIVAFLLDDKDKTLVVHRLTDGVQKTLTGVTDFAASKDGVNVVYATGEGVFAMSTADWNGTPLGLVSGKGKYSKFAWDEKQAQLAFLSSDSVYLWDRKPGAARALVTSKVSDRGSLSFSRDGARLFFPTAPEKPAMKKEDGPKVNYDLWHYKDDHIQPMQKVQAAQDRNRTYRAVIHIADAKVVALAGPDLQEIFPNENGLLAFANDDRAYRVQEDYGDTNINDQYLVNTLTGERKLLGKGRRSNYSWSPDGRYGIRFDSKDWLCLNVATGTEANLTNGLNAAFFNEDYDSPGRPGSYAPATWTKDGKAVLLADRYDIWQVSPDGRLAKNLTDGVGRKRSIQFRVVRTDSEERLDGLDAAKPVLLRGESLESRETGFFVDTVDGSAEPRQLIWSDKNYSNPVRAKNADVMMLMAATFREYPDLVVTNSEMKAFTKVTDANPQIAGFLWGTSELMAFRSTDGKQLKAAVYKPEGFDPSKKYPVMVYIYERLSQNVNNFAEPRPTNSINIPIYVSNGYIVITPDIAYREGYPGDSAMACVIPAVQKLIEKGYVDEKRIAIQGHSWGGYQIAYMLTRTNLFRAAEAGAVVVNMFSAYNGIRWGPGRPRQFQYERTQSRIGGTPWQYPMRFIENSPLFRMEQVKTPVLTMHNDADDAVPWYQGIEFYLSLRRLGKEIYLFNYNGEPHNLRIRANQMHFSQRMFEFFEHFLKDAPKPEWMERGRPYLEREPGGSGRASQSDENILK
jgi:dipeptidyl aminopeptidase/acylaminoacyl peptidase